MTAFDESGVVEHLFMLFKDVGFEEVEGKKQSYHFLGEEWLGLELELMNKK